MSKEFTNPLPRGFYSIFIYVTSNHFSIAKLKRSYDSRTSSTHKVAYDIAIFAYASQYFLTPSTL
jgi:hypothetical protein